MYDVVHVHHSFSLCGTYTTERSEYVLVVWIVVLVHEIVTSVWRSAMVDLYTFGVPDINYPFFTPQLPSLLLKYHKTERRSSGLIISSCMSHRCGCSTRDCHPASWTSRRVSRIDGQSLSSQQVNTCWLGNSFWRIYDSCCAWFHVEVFATFMRLVRSESGKSGQTPGGAVYHTLIRPSIGQESAVNWIVTTIGGSPCSCQLVLLLLLLLV